MLSIHLLLPFFLMAILTIVQSIFGVGILLFGTPIMLALGHSYEQTLLFLLPTSIVLSWSQVFDYSKISLGDTFKRNFFYYCFPFLLIGQFLSLELTSVFPIKLLVLFMLIFSLMTKLSISLKMRVDQKLKKSFKVSLIGMGLIHGLSNMGGALLAPIMSIQFQDKVKILAGTGFYYALMASTQLAIALIFGKLKFELYYLIGPIIGLFVRYLIGNKIFLEITPKRYQNLINFLIFVNIAFLSLKIFF